MEPLFPRALTLASALLVAACGGASRSGNITSYASAQSQFLSDGWYFQEHGTKVTHKTSKRAAFVVSRRCAQGPITVTIPALGGGREFIWFHWFGGVAVKGHWEAKYAGKTISSTFATRTDSGWVEKPANEHCVAAPGEAASIPSGGGGGAGGGGSSTTTTTMHPPSGGGEVVVFTPIDATPSGKQNTSFSFSIDEKLDAGASITFTFWSETPNDFDGITIFVEQGTLVPDDPVKWQAGFDADIKAKADANVSSDEKWKRRSKCLSLWGTTKEWSAECKAEFGDDNLTDDRRRACWDVWYKKKDWSDACRKEFGDGPIASSTGASSPTSKPPPAPADPVPPKPSVHAEWVPGSYSWSGTVWVWSAGFFRVPKADIDSGQTSKASTAPPPDKPETPPPQPSPSAVWTPGWWSISLSGWVWVGGAWRLPPTPGATWRAFVWVKVQATFVLQPGGWVMP